MDETGGGVIPHSTAVKSQCCIAKLGRSHSWHANIDRHGLHMEAVPRYTVPADPQILIRLWCAVAADHVDLRIGTS